MAMAGNYRRWRTWLWYLIKLGEKMTTVFLNKPNTTIPVAKQIAHTQLLEVEKELDRRVGMHRDLYNAFWNSEEATPEEIALEMGTDGGLWFISAQLNVEHIATFCEQSGLNIIEVLGAEYLTRPKEVTINPDGTLTLTDLGLN